MTNESYLLSVVTFLPLLGSLGLLALRGDDHVWIRRLALATAVANFVLSLLMLRGFRTDAPGYQLEEFRRWISSPGINYHMGVDGLSLWLVILTTLLTPIAMLCSWESIQKRVKEFFLMLLVLETGMIGVFLALDLILFFVFWEVMLVPMYFLIGIWGHERRVYAAIKFVLYTMAGSVLMLVAILWLYGLSAASVPGGTFDLPTIQILLQTSQLRLAHTTELLLFGAFFLAFAIKVPLFPLHTWLPDAHVEAPTAGSVILAGVLLKMGTYGLLRFCLPLFPAASRELAPWVAGLAIIGIVYGALVSMVQPDLKKLIAYSSVSHLGFVVLGIFSFHPIAIQGAIYQMLNHGISTGALFLIAGMLYDRRHTHMIKEFGGLATPMPVLSAFFLFVCLSSLGLPMLNGFVGEFLILLGTYQVNKLWATFGALGVILAAVYLLWAYQRVAFGDVTHEKNRALPDCSPRERLILWPLCVLILWMGIGSPLFLSRTEKASTQVIEQMKRPQMPELASGEMQINSGAACCAPTSGRPTKTTQKGLDTK
ncbi:MAG: NADH-quinone oxidoreductase subunit M [Acidobacteria bacterium]|nr:NADH-quinone oxidoreductase subunit M [Acidobacteriota bacterium]MCL5286807.1 NADH-quinone oxidoreductase subunit M [Acidobacteriota bacterium]